MKTASAITAIPFLIVFLTWLSLRAIDLDAERFDQALAEMDRFGFLEAELHRDILSARAGTLRNYDPLARETSALNDSVDRLRRTTAFFAPAISSIDHLATMVLQQEGLVEQFKSNNALLQNSLAYIALFSGEESGPLAPLVSSLAAAMLRFTLDTSPGAASAVKIRLEVLTRRWIVLANWSQDNEASSMEALLAHVRLLHDLLPKTDVMLKGVLAVPQAADQAILQETFQAQRSASRQTARQYRMFLYVASLLLVGLLICVGLQLRERSRALRRRAAFEHVLAGISMSFVAAREEDFDAALENALMQMARCIGAERAYVLVTGSPSPRSYKWNADPAQFGPDWPNRAFIAVKHLTSTLDWAVHIASVKRMPPGTAKDILLSAGLRGWACVGRCALGDMRILLGFDAVGRVKLTGDLGLLRMAVDAVTNALSRQMSERERARLELRLQQARRLETVGTLASGIAHNFNNIVGAIFGYVEMAHDRRLTSDVICGIRQACERARELVDQVLTFARPREQARKPVDVRALVTETVSLLRATQRPTVELLVGEVPEGLVTCGADAPLQQVILNLCNNAAQAMNDSGRIELNVEAIDIGTARSLSHSVLVPGNYVRISVSDSGRGIDQATLEQIFEPFFTTRATGNGLGLATALHIVRELGGAINVLSTVGAGSRFEVWLPRMVPETSAPHDDIATLPLGRGETVLIVEDDGERLLRDEEVLAALGYEPVGCASVVDAVQMFRESPERFDAVIVGRLAPATAALHLARTLHGMAKRQPILLAATLADDLDAKALMASGIADVVHWPLMISEIAAALHASRGTAPDGKVAVLDGSY